MSTLKMISAIVDDAFNSAIDFSCWSMEDKIIFSDRSGHAIDDVCAIADDETVRQVFDIIFELDENQRWIVTQIEYENEDNERIVCDVRESIRQEMESMDLLDVYYKLCDAAVSYGLG